MNKTRAFVLAFLLFSLGTSFAFAATVRYTYDELNRLTRVEYEDGTIIEYGYDAAGNRTSYKTIPSSGSLTMALSPARAVDDGARWNVDAGVWQPSGATVSGLSVGSHVVSFKTLAGWTTPAAQNLAVAANQTTSGTGNYVMQKGSLKVTLKPNGAVAAGARWKVDDGTWKESGATVSGLQAGRHAVYFKNIKGWTKPAKKTVSIQQDRTKAVTGTYVLRTGSLLVTITPKGAVAAGAKWKVDTLPWKDSGDTVPNLPVGKHSVQFRKIGGWKAPAGFTVTIKRDVTIKASRSYVKSPGSSEGIAEE
ncbi:MAG TPA: RHS repeat protein [Syntrophobacteraceae bacterium]|nr:RHS repeat protein [Syntrophobacteraceae bacterium]